MPGPSRRRRTLESLLVVALLGGVAWSTVPRLSGAATRPDAASLGTTLRQVRARLETHRFSPLVRTNDAGWPMAISPEWFSGERFPTHPVTGRELLVESVDAGDGTRWPEELTYDALDETARSLWYNRANGAVAIRVPRGASEAETLALFRATNALGR